MTNDRKQQIKNLIIQTLELAEKHIQSSRKILKETKQSFSGSENVKIPGDEVKTLKFGQFTNKEFVVMMTDIRRSTDIINSNNGVEKMFKIFYAYSAVVANIVSSYDGTSTEFLGDGIINLFEVNGNVSDVLIKSMRAARDINFVKDDLLNPIFKKYYLPNIDIGIGIDYGLTIVTRFGKKYENDLKAFGKCIYNVSRLCKGENDIRISETAFKNIFSKLDRRLFRNFYDTDNNINYYSISEEWIKIIRYLF
jgi:class 3 adenylate cyclase